MAYNTKPIAKDVDGNPISQYYNPETDQYEPVEGQAGANKVILYSSDGTENTGISLLPILEKLEQLTGTVIDEETRKSNELQRQELYNQIKNMLETGQLKGDKGDTGAGLEFTWQGTKLGVRIEGQTEYIYVDLQGPQGLQGPPGTIENLTSEHVTTALGYTPASETNVGNLSLLTTADKTNLVNAINEVNSKSVDLTPVEEKIDNLAGAGRTTETVKGNADALAAHLSDNTPHREAVSIERKNPDDDGVFTLIEFRRSDGTLFKTSQLNGTSPYNSRIVKYYDKNENLMQTVEYSITYSNDEVVSEVIISAE